MDNNVALRKAPALSALTYAVQAQTYSPYIDGQCTKPIANLLPNGIVYDVK